jgi:S-adenosylmethionine:tRNA-ribosyltransferase-isomerase (queuine synthetase)
MKLDDFDFDLPEAADRHAARAPAILRAASGGRGRADARRPCLRPAAILRPGDRLILNDTR